MTGLGFSNFGNLTKLHTLELEYCDKLSTLATLTKLQGIKVRVFHEISLDFHIWLIESGIEHGVLYTIESRAASTFAFVD